MERSKLPVKYNPAWCEHKLPGGLSAWQFQSEEQSNVNGGPNKVTIHVCLQCGSINVGGYRTSKDGKSTNRFNETFHIYFQDAIDAIIKQANFYNEEVIWGRIDEARQQIDKLEQQNDKARQLLMTIYHLNLLPSTTPIIDQIKTFLDGK